MHRLFRQNIDQFGHVFADRALPVVIEGCRKPNRCAIRQRAKTGVEMIKARIDELDRDDQAAKHVCNGAMRLNVGTKLVPAKKQVPTEERIAFAFEVKVIGQP